jgi:hypothetical protein
MSTNNTTPATTAGTDLTTQKSAIEVSFTALVKGITTELVTVDPFEINGKALARAAVLGSLQARIDAAEKTRAARTAFHLAVEAERVVAADANSLRADLKVFLQSRFGSRSTKLQEFGFVPRKRGKATAAKKADAVQKAKATKKARGIVGKKQRKLIHAPAQPATTSPAATAPALEPATTAPAASPVAPKAPAAS